MLLAPIVSIPLFFILFLGTLVLAMSGIIHGEPVVPLTLTTRRFVSSTTGTRCMPKVYILFFPLPMTCDFYANPYLFSGCSF